MNIASISYFILTRFNIRLWNKDKEGQPVRTKKWLEHRFELFERYCLPSVKNQTCPDFTWIVLFDSTTPERFKDIISEYQNECPQLVPVFVEPQNGRYFAQIFEREVRSKISEVRCDKVLTTYLDNDDSLNVRLVEDLRQRVQSVDDGTFFYYTEGYQYFTDHQYLMKIHYPRNHFVSVVEKGNPSTVKTIYGYGSHYYIDKIKDVKIEYVNDLPMWCQVVHDKNMGNDAYFLGAKMVKDDDTLKRDFNVNEELYHSIGVYLFKFLPRYCKTFVRRATIKLRGNRFE